MPWPAYVLLIAIGLLLAVGGIWQGLRPNFVTRKRNEISEQMGRSRTAFTRANTQLSGYLVAAGGVAVVVVGTIWLFQTVGRTG